MAKNTIGPVAKICFLFLFVSQTYLAMSQEENLNVFNRWIDWSDGENMRFII
jgi:hypothetical protein